MIATLHRGAVLVVHFDGSRISGEHGYGTPPTEGLFGEEFERIPGVTRMH